MPAEDKRNSLIVELSKHTINLWGISGIEPISVFFPARWSENAQTKRIFCV